MGGSAGSGVAELRGREVRVHPTALVEEGVVLGDHTKVWDNVHIRHHARLGRYVSVGEKSYIAYEVENDLRSLGFNESEVAQAVAIRQRVTDFVIGHPTIDTLAWDSLKVEVSAVASERWFP